MQPDHPELDAVRELVGLEDDAGRPVAVTVEQPLHPANQRLMDYLGVEVRVVTQPVRGRSMGGYQVEGAREPFEPNWIDFRHSIVQAGKRSDAGDETLEICAYCMCEVDVDPQPHRPDCPGIGVARATSGPVLANVELSSAPAPRPAVHAGSPLRDVGLDALARMDAGEPQAPELDDDPVRDSAEPVSRSSSTKPPKWTRELIVDAIVRWHDEHGELPRASEWIKSQDGSPVQSTVLKVFGSWSAAIAAAGFEPRKRGGQTGQGSRSRGSSPGGGHPAREVTPESPQPSAAPEERGTRRTVGAGRGPRSSDAAELATLTLDQLVAAGGAMEAISHALQPLDKPDRAVVWQFVRPLIEEALADR